MNVYTKVASFYSCTVENVRDVEDVKYTNTIQSNVSNVTHAEGVESSVYGFYGNVCICIHVPHPSKREYSF